MSDHSRRRDTFSLTKVQHGDIPAAPHRTLVRIPNGPAANSFITSLRRPHGIFAKKVFEMGGIDVDARRGIASWHRISTTSRRRSGCLSAGVAAIPKGSLGSARVDGEAGA